MDSASSGISSHAVTLVTVFQDLRATKICRERKRETKTGGREGSKR